MPSSKRARQLFLVHRWTGLLSGLVVLFLSLTGAALVFKNEIDRMLNAAMLVSHGSGAWITPEQAVAAVTRVHTRARVESLQLPQDAHDVYLATTNRLRTADGRTVDQIAIDPYSGRLLGARSYQRSFTFVLRQMHLRFFFFGWQGRVVVGLFGVVLLLSTITGLLIYGRFIRALPAWYAVRRARGFQIATSDWHKLVGIVALAFNALIASTGTVLGLENLARYSERASQALHPHPVARQVPPPPAEVRQVVPVSVALRQARLAIPGFRPTRVNLPTRKRHYVVLGNLAGRTAMEEASEVAVNATTGEAYFVSDARTTRPVTRAYYWMDPLHFGYWGGVASRFVYVLLGLTTGFLSVTGFLVWYAKTWRRPRRAARVA